jgi:thiol-disulfide isomerase/thioredoxin
VPLDPAGRGRVRQSPRCGAAGAASLKLRASLLACVMGLVACGQAADPASDPPRPSEAECDALYDALSDEQQRAFQAWSAEMKAVQGTERFEAVRARATEITREFLARFEELAGRDCGRAKCEVLDLVAHLEPFEEARVDAALVFLEDLVREHANAWWIADLADNDVMRYLLWSPRRGDALALYEELIARTSDEEARCALLLQIGLARLRDPRGDEDRAAALRALDRVVEGWPRSREAEWARGVLRYERELQVGRAMPLLEGRDIDGVELRLADLRGRVVVVDFFGFWCVPCREGLPLLKELLARHAPDELAVLGVDAYDDEATFRRERERFGVSWPCMFDGREGSISKSLGVIVFPAVFVLDRAGVIRAKNPSGEELERVVQDLVREE